MPLRATRGSTRDRNRYESSPWEERARQGEQAQDPLMWAAAAGCAAWVCPARLVPR